MNSYINSMLNLTNIVKLTYLNKDEMMEAIDTHAGYRYIHYIEDETRGGDNTPIGKIYLLGYSKKDESRTCFEISDYPLSLWHRTTIPEQQTDGWVDAYGKPITRKEFCSEKERRKYVSNLKKRSDYEANQIICNDRPIEQFMKDVFISEAISAEGNQGYLRTFFLDIETEISSSFMPPHIAGNRINMITVFDTDTKTFYTWTLNPVKVLTDTTGEGYKYIAYDFNDNEKALLTHFLHFWEQNYPDVVCGWNSYEFDIPYIIIRCEHILGKTMTRRFSPFNEYTVHHFQTDEIDEETGKNIDSDEIENIIIPGISQLDELKLYRDKFQVKAALDGGYGLGNVGLAEELGDKVRYETTLLDLYLTDWQKFYEYNVRDVDLLYAIEKKCKLIPLARSVAGFGFCNYEEIYFSRYILSTLALYTLKNRDHVMFNTYGNKFREKKPYEGAFVFDPIPGRYSGGIGCVDFNSLYPSCMRAMNLSPETYVGQLIWPEGDHQWDTWQKIGGVDGLKDDYMYDFIIDRNDIQTPKQIQLTKQQIKELLNTKCLICGPNFTFFLKHEVKRGIIADWCSDFFAWRKSVKAERSDYKKTLHKEKDTSKQFELKTKIENLTNLQQCIKIFLNSCYGQLGLSSSPLYNPAIVQSVTRLGRFCNLNGSRLYKEWLTKTYNIDSEEVTTVGGDTDSLFVSLEPIVKSFSVDKNLPLDLNKWDDQSKLNLWEFVSKFVDTTLIPEIQALVTKFCHTSNAKVLRYGLEYIGSGGIYESPKHYGVHKIIDEGPELVDKFKFTGIELKKATVPAEVKAFLKDIYCTAIVDPKFTDDKLIDKLSDVYEKIQNMNANEIGQWRGYNKENEMGEGFLNVRKGMTGISKAVGFYNQIAEDMGISKKYGTIELGDKSQTVYIKPSNKYGINIIAFKPHTWPTEFDDVFEIDKPKMFEKVIMSPLKNFFNALKFTKSKNYNPELTRNLAFSVDDI